MNREEILEKIISIISDKLNIEESEISEKARLMEDLQGDSLDVIDVVMSIESEFDISILDEEVEKWHIVKNVVDYIEDKLSG